MNFHTVMSDCWCIQSIWRRQKWTRVHQNNKNVPLLNTQTVLLLNYWVRERECVQTCHMNSKWSKKYLARHQTFFELKIRGKKSEDSPIFFIVENSFRFTRFLSHTHTKQSIVLSIVQWSTWKCARVVETYKTFWRIFILIPCDFCFLIFIRGFYLFSQVEFLFDFIVKLDWGQNYDRINKLYGIIEVNPVHISE